jgi:DNA topoisomerase-1
MKPTSLGMKINELLTDNFIDVTGSELTAKMEDELDEISNGKKEYIEVLTEFWTGFKKEVETKSANIVGTDKYTSSETDEKCPTCRNKMELKMGRFGEYFQCQETREHQLSWFVGYASGKR